MKRSLLRAGAVLALLLGEAACVSRGMTTIEGTARNVKGGAAVLDGGGKPTRVDGIDAWPDDVVGRMVVVSGRIERHSGPVCVNDPMPCQGVSGEYDVLVEARWRAR